VTTFSDSGLFPSTEYHYRVRATNANGDSAYSNTASAMTHGTEATIPSAPTNLTATSANGLKITLKWNDTAANELGFRVERSLDGTSFTDIGTVGADTTTYTDSGPDRDDDVLLSRDGLQQRWGLVAVQHGVGEDESEVVSARTDSFT
jgi:hypothetical protein